MSICAYLDSGIVAEQFKGSLNGVARKFEIGMLAHSCVVKENILSEFCHVTPQISHKLHPDYEYLNEKLINNLLEWLTMVFSG